jgi:hypothetical protein
MFSSFACAAEPTTQPVDIAQIKAAFPKQTAEDQGVLTLKIPRDDLGLTVDGYEVPGSVAATVIQFWQCPCGRFVMAGQFCVADYESNDVMDELRKGGAKIASVAPMLIQERPKVLLIRFQGEGHAPELIKMIQSALEYVGDARNAPAKKP